MSISRYWWFLPPTSRRFWSALQWEREKERDLTSSHFFFHAFLLVLLPFRIFLSVFFFVYRHLYMYLEISIGMYTIALPLAFLWSDAVIWLNVLLLLLQLVFFFFLRRWSLGGWEKRRRGSRAEKTGSKMHRCVIGLHWSEEKEAENEMAAQPYKG